MYKRESPIWSASYADILYVSCKYRDILLKFEKTLFILTLKERKENN